MKYALGIEYRGVDFFGWQRQSHTQQTVQHAVESAITRVANEPIRVYCAGRTDTGVHATGQVIHFETSANRALNSWLMGINTNLPKTIRVRWVKPVTADFHARFSAQFRRYHYVIYDHSVSSAVLHGLVTPWHCRLNGELMHQAGQILVGEQDLSSFRAANCQSNSPFRCVHHLRVMRHRRALVIDIQANAFLYHMVRNIVGSLIWVGMGKKDSAWFETVFYTKDRRLAAPTAPPNGLYLVAVGYDLRYNILSGDCCDDSCDSQMIATF
ncbi:tRNA pseudouridine(38-40) synthase TruA [Ostreibacterium oceani]|uniref:tRNA pseudouridine synthase A n=1 Tax=Ostreibacterium oceani TaxID=2654998 RepID=A0A6N7EWU3_9GAMM|nr:tRNA pseudouridine(38-40) synthase TruA [Ostreibacterium oceani]MPV85889.1 tRNA pseudouridine(38-40) synthase TruA [Ostreibacterium oceani]